MPPLLRAMVVGLAALGFGAVCKAAPPALKPLVGRAVADFSLPHHGDKTIALSDFRQCKLLVIAFLGTECPLAKLYGPRLEKLSSAYAPKGVGFIGINANCQDSNSEVAVFAKRHKLTFPILKDVNNRVADSLQAIRTPEVFVLDGNRVLRYWGCIDDQYGVGYARKQPKRHYLAEALNELLQGKPVSVPVRDSVGCHIGRVPRPQRRSGVTFREHVAPILRDHCVECHRPGEIAPFSLIDYDQVSGWAETIAEVVRDNRMPPWHASSKYGEFSNERGLSEQQKQIIQAWFEAGAPEGDEAKPLRPQDRKHGWQLPQEPDAVIYMKPTPHRVRAEGQIEYQFFRVDPGFKTDKWVKMFEIRPGNREVVHHILVFVRTARSAGDCEAYLAAFVPGMRAAPLPEGMAKRIPAGATLTFQVHYTANGSPQLDRSMIGLVYADEADVKHAVVTESASLTDRHLKILPRLDNQKFEATARPLRVDVQLLSMMPHMHYRGKSFRFEVRRPSGSSEILLDVPRYDFNWQTSYRLRKPHLLPAGARVHCTAHFDNSASNPANPDPLDTVYYGSQSWQEMMYGYFDYAIRIEDYRRYVMAYESPAQARAEWSRQILLRFDRDADGRLSLSETPAVLQPRFKKFDKDRNKFLSREELSRRR